MLGGMQEWDLRVSGLIDHAARAHPDREIVSHWADGARTRTTWSDLRLDALRMVQALRRLDMYPGDRIATLAMNHSHHLASWFGITGAGCVLHTINPRLSGDQLEYIVNHAGDRVLIYDAQFHPVVERLRPRWPTVEHYVCFDDPRHAVTFADWIAVENGDAAWGMGDERDPCMLCYTSGTTGDPKGVLYSHRSNVLHTLAMIQPACLAIEPRSVVLPVVPMFHANNWGLPWACAATGAKMVYSQVADPAVLCDLMTAERVTHVGGVPTVWFALFEYVESTGRSLPPFALALSGGSAVPSSIVERLMRAGVRVVQAWGMTETSPIATVTYEPPEWDDMTFAQQVACKSRQGRAVYGSEVRVVSLSDTAHPVAGDVAGALQVRGCWTINRYFEADEDVVGPEQWFDTGDVATMSAEGEVRLTDRTKDLIKSGGEWISSVDLENAAVAHPDVFEAAAIAVAHPRWEERPLLVVVRRPGTDVTAAALRDFLALRVAKWCLPDAIEFLAALPRTGTGKVSKKDLRAQFSGYRLPD